VTQWHFNKRRKGDRKRERKIADFFSADVISEIGEPLVREGIQNALDASSRDGKVSVRINYSGKDEGLAPEAMAVYLGDGWEHFSAPECELRDLPDPGGNCPFLVFEDFGTTGLGGDPNAWEVKEGVDNPFFNFYRAEGASPKTGTDQIGSHGVGKCAFGWSSRIGAFFGLTVREEDHRRLLMGTALLKYHHIGKNSYMPDGDFGDLRHEEEDDPIIVPVEQDELLDRFSKDFGLQRDRTPGLSVVVPWPELQVEGGLPGIEAERKVDSLTRSVIRSFFDPIIRGRLEVSITAPKHEVRLTKETIRDAMCRLSEEVVNELKPFVDLAEWGAALPDSEFTTIEYPPDNKAPRWRAGLISETDTEAMRKRLHDGENLAVRVPVYVKKKAGEQTASFFDVLIAHDTRGSSLAFVRGGLLIPGVKGMGAGGYSAVVLVEDRDLTTFLGDSENPAHTEWQTRQPNFKGKYSYADETIVFVRNSVHNIIHLLTEDDEEKDPAALLGFFSLPGEEGDPIGPAGPGGVRKRRPKPPPKKIPTEPRPCRISGTNDGFRVSPGDGKQPEAVEIKMAYDNRMRGNPISKYSATDFSLTQSNITDQRGIEIVACEQNRIAMKIIDSEFKLVVGGFDPNRDLYIRAEALENDDAGQ